MKFKQPHLPTLNWTSLSEVKNCYPFCVLSVEGKGGRRIHFGEEMMGLKDRGDTTKLKPREDAPVKMFPCCFIQNAFMPNYHVNTRDFKIICIFLHTALHSFLLFLSVSRVCQPRGDEVGDPRNSKEGETRTCLGQVVSHFVRNDCRLPSFLPSRELGPKTVASKKCF